MEFVKDFKFSDKIHDFLKTIELCLNFCMEFCINYYYQIITKSVHKKTILYQPCKPLLELTNVRSFSTHFQCQKLKQNLWKSPLVIGKALIYKEEKLLKAENCLIHPQEEDLEWKTNSSLCSIKQQLPLKFLINVWCIVSTDLIFL